MTAVVVEICREGLCEFECLESPVLSLFASLHYIHIPNLTVLDYPPNRRVSMWSRSFSSVAVGRSIDHPPNEEERQPALAARGQGRCRFGMKGFLTLSDAWPGRAQANEQK